MMSNMTREQKINDLVERDMDNIFEDHKRENWTHANYLFISKLLGGCDGAR